MVYAVQKLQSLTKEYCQSVHLALHIFKSPWQLQIAFALQLLLRHNPKEHLNGGKNVKSYKVLACEALLFSSIKRQATTGTAGPFTSLNWHFDSRRCPLQRRKNSLPTKNATSNQSSCGWCSTFVHNDTLKLLYIPTVEI